MRGLMQVKKAIPKKAPVFAKKAVAQVQAAFIFDAAPW